MSSQDILEKFREIQQSGAYSALSEKGKRDVGKFVVGCLAVDVINSSLNGCFGLGTKDNGYGKPYI